MPPVSVLVVDTSIWVEFFRGGAMPDLELALREGLVLLAPVVAAELLSAPLAPRKRAKLVSFLRDLPLHPTPFEHWASVGQLREQLGRRALSVSTPDAHVAQCALDAGGHLWSRDKIFVEMARKAPLRLFQAS